MAGRRGRGVRGLGPVVALVALATLSGCQPEPPFFPEVRTAGYQASAGWIPVAGDFDANGRDDILWYDGDRHEQLWLGHGDAAFRKVPAPGDLGPGYRPVVGDFGGDRADDVLWYAGGGAPSPVWIMAAGGTLAQVFEVDLVAADDVDLVRDTASRDGLALSTRDGAVWLWDADAPGEVTAVVPARGAPVAVAAGDFDGDGSGDLFLLHRPQARVAWGDGRGGVTVAATRGVTGPYGPVALHLDHDSRADLVFTSDSVGKPLPTPVWFGSPDRTFRLTTQAPIPDRGVDEVHHDSTFAGADTLVRYGNHGVSIWHMDRSGTIRTPPAGLSTSIGPAHVHTRVIGEFNGGGAEDVLIYDAVDDQVQDPEHLLLTHDGQD